MLAALASAGLITGCNGGSTTAQVIPEGTTVSVALLETTDIHSNVLSYNYYALAEDTSLGLERTSTLIQAARAETRTTCCSTMATSSRAPCWPIYKP